MAFFCVFKDTERAFPLTHLICEAMPETVVMTAVADSALLARLCPKSLKPWGATLSFR
jgi:hypothetical protein